MAELARLLEVARPKYLAIYRFLSTLIVSGRLPPGLRLPPTRDLARHLRVTRQTALEAYAELEARNLVVGKVGSGTYVQKAKAGPS